MKKAYWKNIFRSLTQSMGRFLSIMLLMMLGSFAYVGLKSTTPDMQQSGITYLNKHQTMDLAILSDYGLSQDDQSEINQLANVKSEWGYFSDVESNSKAFRLFSNPQTISTFALMEGTLPKEQSDIALSINQKEAYPLGSTIAFTQSDDGILKETHFTVVGYVKSSEMWHLKNMGASSIGDGLLKGYGVVLPDVFDTEVFTIVRLKFDDLNGVDPYSSEYTQKLNVHKEMLRNVLSDNGIVRFENLKTTISNGIDEGYEQINDAQKQLIDAQNDLNSAQEDITNGYQRAEQAQAELEQSRQTLLDSQKQLRYFEETLATKRQQLDDAKGQLTSAQQTIDEQDKKLQATRNQLDSAKGPLETSREQLESYKAILEQQQNQLDEAKQQLQTQMSSVDLNSLPLEKRQQLEQQLMALNSQQSQLDTLWQQYNVKYNQYAVELARYQSGVMQYEEGTRQLRSAQEQLKQQMLSYEEGERQFNAAQHELETNRQKLESGYSAYASGEQQLRDSFVTLAQAQQTLNEKLAEFSSQKVEADQEIADNQEKLEDAQKSLDKLRIPVYSVYTRSTMPGGEQYFMYQSSSKSIAGVSDIFPIVLYLVAALVTYTTMTRFVDEERINMGVYKALGYTDKQIMQKFILYGLIAGLIGSLIGILAGFYFLPPLIAAIMVKGTVIDTVQLGFYSEYALFAIGLTLISTLLPAWRVAKKELKEKPAALLLPKPPVKGNKILLERLSFVWTRLSFTHKVTARNIFRYKQRMLMTIFGVAGSVTLLFGGLGIQSSIAGVSNVQFQQLMAYDMLVSVNKNADEMQHENIKTLLGNSGVYQPIVLDATTQTIAGVSEDQAVTVIAVDSNNLEPFINLRNRQTKELIELNNSGVILSEKLATLYNVSIGDTVTVLDAYRTPYDMRVEGITEMYTGHFIFMNKTQYETIYQKEFSENGYLVQLNNQDDTYVSQLAATVLAQDGVIGVSRNSVLVNNFNTIVNSLNQTMLVLIVVSVILAVVILYNLTNINVSERIRELSTIKVQGFYNKEVTLYIYRETIVLSLVGIGLGLVGGNLLHQLLIQIIAPYPVMFDPIVTAMVYAIPIISVSTILFVLGIVVNRRLKHVDMLEALKSVE